ncbi:fibronectin type III domain-containing protein [Thiohalomonas denitrificans]|uniref:fibronectin type III domain-containing protein n=1 Tax=Thiohalomonas denitrificans TaxID=415747 RepID=UPI0026F28E20|nr:fibronectin type III domain-containing protein [Thiohalomonas denitrificans]
MPSIRFAWVSFAVLLFGTVVLGLGACSKPATDQERPEITKRGAQLHQVELSWDPPTARADGAGITPEELGGYKIYYGTSPESMDQVIKIEDRNKTGHVIHNLAPRTYYFAVTAYDRTGRESTISEIVSKTIEPTRNSPEK